MTKVAIRRSAFAITDIPSVALHLDANAGVYVDAGTTLATDGQTVRQWNDASGQARHVSQATAGLRPTYRATGLNGQPSVQFASSRLVSPAFFDATFNASATMFYISTGSSATAISADEWGFAVEHRTAWNRYYADAIGVSVAQNVGAQVDAGGYRCVGISYDGTTWRTMINGHLVKWTATGNLGLTGVLSVGAMSTTPAYFVGHLGEVYVWRHGATDTQMRDISSYLFTRWGITAPAPRRTICYVGDSMTFDFGTRSSHYPGMIEASMGCVNQSHNDYAVSGVTLSWLADRAATYVDRFVDSGQALRINTIFAGTNDLAGSTTAANLYNLVTSWVAARKAAGWHKVVVFTVLPRSVAGDAADFEAKRQSFNTLLRAGWATFADGLCDLAADGRMGDAGDELDLTYYVNDRVHPNATGQGVIAELLQPVLETLL